MLANLLEETSFSFSSSDLAGSADQVSGRWEETDFIYNSPTVAPTSDSLVPPSPSTVLAMEYTPHRATSTLSLLPQHDGSGNLSERDQLIHQIKDLMDNYSSAKLTNNNLLIDDMLDGIGLTIQSSAEVPVESELGLGARNEPEASGR